MNKFTLLHEGMYKIQNLGKHIGLTIYRDESYFDSLYDSDCKENANQFMLQLEGQYSHHLEGSLYFELKKELTENNLLQNLDIEFNGSYHPPGFDFHNYKRKPIVINKETKTLLDLLMYKPSDFNRIFTMHLCEKLDFMYEDDEYRPCYEAHRQIVQALIQFGSKEFCNTLLATLKNEIDIWNSNKEHNQVLEENYI